MHELMSFELGRFNESLSTLGAHVHARTVSMQMLSHGAVVAEHLVAAFMRTSDGARNIVAGPTSTTAQLFWLHAVQKDKETRFAQLLLTNCGIIYSWKLVEKSIKARLDI